MPVTADTFPATLDWIYTPNDDNSARTLLGVEGRNPLVCIGINPSTAAPESLDRTVATVERVSRSNGFQGFMMLNVYPQRATDPKDLHVTAVPDLHEWNLRDIAGFIDGQALSVWAAWGTLIQKRRYLSQQLREIVSLPEVANVEWVTRGARSKAGHPHHPLYVRADAPLEAFEMTPYLASLR